MELRDYQLNAMQDIRKAYRAGFKSPCLVAICGWGKSCVAAEIAKLSTEKGNRVLFLVHRIELVEQITKTFTDWGVDLSLCDIMMVQTASRRISKLPEYNFIIVDENHHAGSNTYVKIFENFPKALRLGITATPVRGITGEGLHSVNDVLIESVSTKWLIENKFLAPYKYYAPQLMNVTELKIKSGDYDPSDAEKRLSSPKIYGDIVKHYKELASGLKAILYAPTLAYSKSMAELFTSEGISAEHIDGETPKDERTKIMNRFRNGQTTILCNMSLISEGVSVDDCSVCILLRPTKSLVLHTQSSMRCMRYADNKTAIIIDHVGGCFRHGLPDAVHQWDLHAKRITGNADTSPVELQIRQCLKCYTVFNANTRICPECGHENAPTKKELKVIKDAKLEEIREIREETVRTSRKKIEDCRGMAEVMTWCKLNNKKPGYGYRYCKSKGWVR